ncbi:hypothetical protein Mx4_p81 [Myxococcus phage Mx4]|nr:hypothetical protein Mx4_p81 [Myxococcus phage Mx4]
MLRISFGAAPRIWVSRGHNGCDPGERPSVIPTVAPTGLASDTSPGNNRSAPRPTGVSPTAYRCPGCGAQLERRGTLLRCTNERAHPGDRSTRAYQPGRHGRLVPASRAATPAWRAAVARLTGEPE